MNTAYCHVSSPPPCPHRAPLAPKGEGILVQGRNVSCQATPGLLTMAGNMVLETTRVRDSRTLRELLGTYLSLSAFSSMLHLTSTCSSAQGSAAAEILMGQARPASGIWLQDLEPADEASAATVSVDRNVVAASEG